MVLKAYGNIIYKRTYCQQGLSNCRDPLWLISILSTFTFIPLSELRQLKHLKTINQSDPSTHLHPEFTCMVLKQAVAYKSKNLPWAPTPL